MKLRARLTADAVLQISVDRDIPVLLDGERVGSARVLGATPEGIDIEFEVGDDSVAATAVRAKTTAAVAAPEATLDEKVCQACGGSKEEPRDTQVQDTINVNGRQVEFGGVLTVRCSDGFHRNPVGFA